MERKGIKFETSVLSTNKVKQEWMATADIFLRAEKKVEIFSTSATRVESSIAPSLQVLLNDIENSNDAVTITGGTGQKLKRTHISLLKKKNECI